MKLMIVIQKLAAQKQKNLLLNVNGNVVNTEPNTRKFKKVAEEIPSVKKRGPRGSYYFYCMSVNSIIIDRQVQVCSISIFELPHDY